MPKRSLPRGNDDMVGNVTIRIKGAPQTDTVPAWLAVLAQKLQQLFDEKAGCRACRPGRGGIRKQ